MGTDRDVKKGPTHLEDVGNVVEALDALHGLFEAERSIDLGLCLFAVGRRTAARDALNAEADALIDVSAQFVALAEVKNLPPATRDRVYAVLESAYKTRNPDDAEAAGLQAVIDSKK